MLGVCLCVKERGRQEGHKVSTHGGKTACTDARPRCFLAAFAPLLCSATAASSEEAAAVAAARATRRMPLNSRTMSRRRRFVLPLSFPECLNA